MPVTVLSLMLCVFGITTGEFVIAGILPDVAHGLDVSIPAAGLLVSAYAVGMIVGGPVLTALTTRFARKPLIVILLLVTVAGNLASALAPAWRYTFVAVAACCAVGLLLVLRLVPGGPPAAPGASAVSELRVFRARDVQLALAVTAAGNAGLLAVFTYFAPLLTEVTRFAADAVAVLLLVYGVGATVGNVLGGWLYDRAPMRSQLGLLVLLSTALVLMWLLSASMAATAIFVFVIGALGFAVIPGMQARVLTTASSAPTLAIAVNASGYQLAAAFAAWLGGEVINAGLGLRSIYLVGSAVTVAGIGVSGWAWLRDLRLTRPRASAAST